MTIFTISYDLRNEKDSQGYESLWEALREKNCHRVQDSVWLGNFSNSAKEVHDYLKGFMDNNDRLMVAEFTKKHWYSNARGGTNEWLQNDPPER